MLVWASCRETKCKQKSNNNKKKQKTHYIIVRNWFEHHWVNTLILSIPHTPDLNSFYACEHTNPENLILPPLNLSTTMSKTKELLNDILDKDIIQTCTELVWATRPLARRLVRRWQLLLQLFRNGRNMKWSSVVLDLQHHARLCLVGWGRSWERWRISPKLHRRSFLMIWRHLGTQSHTAP